jgi:hypothetical protein
MLKLRSIGLSDYSVLEGRQRVGRIRLATERMPCVWIWTIQVHLIGELPMGSAKDIDTVTAECEALKARFQVGGFRSQPRCGRFAEIVRHQIDGLIVTIKHDGRY